VKARPVLVLGVLALLATGSAIAEVYARHQGRQLFMELTRVEAERDELNVEYGRLKLEQATWAEANRVEQIARNDLGMGFPTARDSVVVHR